MVVQFILLLGFVTLLIFLTSGADRDRIEQQMDGTVRMIQRQLLAQPPARRPAELATINELFAYPIKLLPAIPAGLGDDARARLASGHLFLLWFGFFGVPMGVLIYLNLRPHWQSLIALRSTANQLAEGDLSARAATLKSPLFAPLGSVINDMATALERQVETRQALAHAVAHELRTPVARLRFGLSMLDEAEDDDERQQYREGMERDLRRCSTKPWT